nr:TonB-dependent receptor [Haliscomenobacter sp.]
MQYLADYDLELGKNKFHILAGYQWEDNRFEGVTTSSNSLVSNDRPTLNLGNDLTKSNSETINTYAFQSVFGRFNYSFNDKYLLEATVRVDESSRLAPGLRTKTFPSASVGWNLHRAPGSIKLCLLFLASNSALPGGVWATPWALVCMTI